MIIFKYFALFVFLFCGLSSKGQSIVIGSKNFTENIILGEMLSILLEEKYQYKVTRKLNIGGTKLVFDALRSKQIDIYPEYTGTGYIMLLGLSGEKDSDKIYKIVKRELLKKYQLTLSKPLGFNNTYALAIRFDDDKFQDVFKVSDLVGRETKLSLGVGHEFMERLDGYEYFVDFYNLSFDRSKIYSMHSGLMYSALNNKKVDMIMSYSTDGRIKAYKLRLLEDDKNYFPAYRATYLTRSDAIKKFPKIKLAFKDLENLITEEKIIHLNDQVDRLKYETSIVARNFLIKENLIEGNRVTLGGKTLISYYYSKRFYLLDIFIEHLILTFMSLLIAIIVSIPMGIYMARKESAARIVFPIINTLQTIPSLALLGFLIPFLGIGYVPAIFTLFVYSLLPLIRNTYEGIKNLDRTIIEAARGIGLTRGQILKRIEIPLALPIIIAGVRTSAVIVVGTATLAALVGAGGLGEPIFRGIAMVNSKLIFLGAVPAAILAVVLDHSLSFLEQSLVSKGVKLKQKRL